MKGNNKKQKETIENDRTGLDKSGQDRTGEIRRGQEMTGQGMTGQVMTGLKHHYDNKNIIKRDYLIIVEI